MITSTDLRYLGVTIATDDEPAIAQRLMTESSVAFYLADAALLNRMLRSRKLRNFIGDAHLLPTTASLRRMISFTCRARARRYDPFSGAVRILSALEHAGASVFVIGPDLASLAQTDANLRATFPGLRIVGRSVFGAAASEDIAIAVRKAAPSALLLGLDSAAVLRWSAGLSAEVALGTLVMRAAFCRMAGRHSTRKVIARVVLLPLRPLWWLVLTIVRLRSIARS